MFLAGSEDVLLDAAVALSCACCAVILLPAGNESVRDSFAFAALYSIVVLASFVLVEKFQNLVPASAVFILVYLCFRLRRKYKHIRLLFRNEEVWQCVEENARWVYVSIFLLICIFFFFSAGTRKLLPYAAAAFAIYYIVMLLRSFLGNTFFISSHAEDLIRNIIKGSLRPENVMTAEEEDTARKARLYEKVQSVMETKRPYLDEDFSLQDLATEVFTNKTYLSKTINLFSGRNFRQYVNYYRVQYSIELMKQDKHLRVSELAMMSGFHTVVTYNMAFKLNTNETPSEYLQKLRLGYA